MITYKKGFLHLFLRTFQCHGSVFPSALGIALPCSALTALMKFLIDRDHLPMLNNLGHQSVLWDNSCWTGFVFLVGFLTVFRTSQAYARFWEGCTSMHRMHAEWYDACASIIAFCKCATAEPETVLEFQRILVRLFSMLHAVALADIEDTHQKSIDKVEAFKYALVDPGGLDVETLRAIKRSPAKVELVFQWIQQLLVQNIENGVLRIPPPLLSRSFQEIGDGMVAFREAMMISSIPFPFPYAQVSNMLLVLHWICTPLVVSQYVATPWAGALFSFLQVFVYWSMNAIATEIENPFGMDANDLDAASVQADMNRNLLLLLDESTSRTPVAATTLSYTCPDKHSTGQWYTETSLVEVWEKLAAHDHDPPVKRERKRLGRRPSCQADTPQLVSVEPPPLAAALTRPASSDPVRVATKNTLVRSTTLTSEESRSSFIVADDLAIQVTEETYSCVPAHGSHLQSVHLGFVDAPSPLLDALAVWGGGLANCARVGHSPL